MDDNTKLKKLETEVAGLAKKVESLTRKLDEARRVCGLSPIIDDQLAFINQRKDRGFAA